MDKQENWYLALRNPHDIWQNHRSYLIIEIIFYLLSSLTFIHACRGGGRYIYLWFATVLHGLVVESLSYFVPDIDNFWHAQSMVMLLGRRLPLHIVFLYPVFIYTAVAVVTRLRLKAVAEACAAGLCVVMIDIPFDIVGIKLLFWTWHDTDPNIADRHYSVPWTSYYFHASFAGAFTFFFHGTRALIGHGGGQDGKMHADGLLKETFCTVVTGMLAMPFGILQFVPLYHSLHDVLHIHSEVCVIIFLSLYFLLAWSGDRTAAKDSKHWTLTAFCDELGLLLLVHFLMFITLSFTEQPQLIRSVGLHQPIGNCSLRTPVHLPTGQVLYKQTYLCVIDYDEPYFDFHCVSAKPPTTDGVSWYQVCGTPLLNRPEYITVVTALSLFGLMVFTQLLVYSSRQPRGTRSSSSSSKYKHD